MRILKRIAAIALAAVTAVTTLYSPTRAKAESANTATLTQAAHYTYEGWGTHLFNMEFAGDTETSTGNAYCIVPERATPDDGEYGVTLCNDQSLRKVFWKCYGVPGASQEPVGYCWTGDEVEAAVVNSHLCLSYCFTKYVLGSDDEGWATGISSGFKQAVITQTETFLSDEYPDPPSSFEVYYLTPSDNTKQVMAGWRYAPNGYAKLKKESAEPTVTDGDDYYSLAGAVYKVYKGDEVVGTLTTDADGNSNTIELPAGTYTAREVTPSSGFKLDPTVYTVTVVSGETATFTSREPIERVSAGLKKESEHPEITAGNSCYSLAGAVYGVYDEDGNQVDTLTTDEDGNSGEIDLTPGTYTVRELTASRGFALDTEEYTIEIEPGSTATFISVEPVGLDPMLVTVYKLDGEGNTIYPLSGAQFTINYYDGYYTEANVPASPTRSWVIETKEMDGVYYARLTDEFKVSGDDLYDVNGIVLPLGTITIQETRAPEHYTTDVMKVTDSNNEVIATSNRPLFGQITDEDRDGLASLSFGNDATYNDKIEKGGVAVQKYDLELANAQAQGSAVLSGAKIEIINDNDGIAVNSDGLEAAKGDVMYTLTTDTNGYAATDVNALPVGRYIARETLAPAGYLLDKRYDGSSCSGAVLERRFTVNAGEITQLTGLDNGIVDQVKRGGVKIQKFDFDSKLSESQGTPDLSGAEFEIISLNAQPVTDEDKEVFNNGDVVYSIITDENGIAETSDRALPVGHYKVVETKAPEGYFLWGILEREFTITEDGEMAQLTTYETSISDRVMRGDLTFLKKDEDNRPMGAIPFQISLLDKNGNVKESHIAYTDDNGKLTTKNRNGVKHSTNTNRNDELEVGMGSWENGIWFGKAPVDDSMGALPYGDYVIQELRCEANKKYDLISFNLTIHPDRMDDDDLQNYEATPTDNNFLLDEGTLHDTIDRHDYTIKSLAWNTAIVNDAGDNRARLLSADKGQAITDEVTWEFDNPKFTDYVVVSKLMDKATGQPFVDASGKSFTIETQFDSEGHSHGSFKVNFEDIDLTGFEGKNIVVFEYLYEAGAYASGGAVNTLADDTDFENDKQTLFVSGLHTTAKDTNTGDEVAAVSEKASLTDTVYYSNLNVGYQYRISGVLMDKETGKAVLDKDGKEIRAEKTFYAESPSGAVDVVFEFDAALMAGKAVVVFEDLYLRDRKLTSHADITDIAQTVYFPEIHTTASDITTEDNVGNALAKPVEIKDTVSYRNLVPGKEYTVSGILMDKATGKPFTQTTGTVETVTEDGGTAAMSAIALVTAEKTFIPAEAEGTVELTFTVNTAESLQGKTVVVFEDLFHNDVKVTSHADIEDEGQTVHFPDVHTTASAGIEDNSSLGSSASEKVTITDTVSFKNLIIGKEYTVKGILMDKETGKPFGYADSTVSGNGEALDSSYITAEKTFTAETEDGTIELELIVDGRKLAGKTVVVFEDLYHEDVKVAAHADIEDEDQTIHFPEVGTKASVDGKNEAVSGKDTKLIDTVSYKNLIPGKEYRVVGKLMVKETGEALKDASGNEITKEVIFTPENPDGEVEIEFVFDSTDLADKTVVVFENVYFNETEIGAHADLEDAGQSVHFTKPEIPEKPETPHNPTPQTFDNSKTVPAGVFGISAVAFALALLFRNVKRKKVGNKR